MPLSQPGESCTGTKTNLENTFRRLKQFRKVRFLNCHDWDSNPVPFVPAEFVICEIKTWPDCGRKNASVLFNEYVLAGSYMIIYWVKALILINEFMT